MKTVTHLQRFKTLLIKGVKISVIPTLLINAFIAVLQSLFLNAVEPSWDFTFQDGVFFTLIGTVFFTIVVLVGIVMISSALTYLNRMLSDVVAGFWGVIIGVILAIIANFVLLIIFYSPDEYFRKYIFDFLLEGIFINALPNLATIFILVYVSRNLNKAEVFTPITDDVLDDPVGAERIELRVAWLVTQVTSLGCIIFFVYQAIRNLVFGDSDWYPQLYDRIAITVIWLGIKLLIALPVVLLGGFLLGVIVKRIGDKSLLSKRFSFLLGILMSFFVFTGVSIAVFIITDDNILEPYFLADFIVGLIIIVVAGIVIGKQLFSNNGHYIQLRRNWFRVIRKTATLLLIASGAVLGIIYLRLTIPSDRELWRSAEYGVFDATILNNMLLFEGFEASDPDDCDYIYAFDKTTGEMIWSTKKIERIRCGEPASPSRTIISTSENDNVIFMSFSYWTVHDWTPLDMTISYILYALQGTDGEILWEVGGFAGDSPLEYSIVETGAIYVINEEGIFSAIDSRTGHPIWEQEVPEMDYWDDTIIIEYYDQIVYYYDSGNSFLIAFDATTGNPIWEMAPHQTSIEEIMVSDELVYLVAFSSEETIEDLYYVTALDVETGEDVWELFFEQAYPVTNIFGNEMFVLTSEWQDEPENNHWLGILDVVNKTTGELLWQFTGDSSNGHNNKIIDYLVEGDTVYVSTEGGVIFALENETGEIIWQTKTSGFPFYLAEEAGVLIAVYEEVYIVGLDTKTGVRKWIADVRVADAWDFHKFLKLTDGVIYLSATLDQKIFAIDIETGSEIWSWQHNHPNDQRYYSLEAVDDNVIYVDQSRDTIFGRSWFFALKTEP